MSEYQGKLDPEFEYVEMSFDGNAVVSENRHMRLSLLPTGLRTECWRYQFVKRLVDVVGALLMSSIVLIPCLAVAALISLTTQGPIFYREWRVGRLGRPFRIWKFRSMTVTIFCAWVVNSLDSSEYGKFNLTIFTTSKLRSTLE